MKTKKGILIVNLGTPDSPNPGDVKKYLNEFLMDPFVIDIPWALRALLVKGIILNTRPKKSAEAYSKIWTERGSPLAFHTQEFVEKLRELIPDRKIEIGMRYGQPSLESGISKLIAQGVNEIFIFQMYPQYAWASSATVENKIREIEKTLDLTQKGVSLKYSKPFFDHPGFIDSWVNNLKLEQQKCKTTDPYILFSFHGIPERHLGRVSSECASHCLKVANCCEQKKPGVYDVCYRAQSYKTAADIAQKAKLKDGRWSVSFQSRLGTTPWLQPFTDKVIDEIAKSQEREVLVVCPSFVCDCLETLEEIQMRLREQFEEATQGKGTLRLVPSLNSNPNWVAAAAQIQAQEFV